MTSARMRKAVAELALMARHDMRHASEHGHVPRVRHGPGDDDLDDFDPSGYNMHEAEEIFTVLAGVLRLSTQSGSARVLAAACLLGATLDSSCEETDEPDADAFADKMLLAHSALGLFMEQAPGRDEDDDEADGDDELDDALDGDEDDDPLTDDVADEDADNEGSLVSLRPSDWDDPGERRVEASDVDDQDATGGAAGGEPEPDAGGAGPGDDPGLRVPADADGVSPDGRGVGDVHAGSGRDVHAGRPASGAAPEGEDGPDVPAANGHAASTEETGRG